MDDDGAGPDGYLRSLVWSCACTLSLALAPLPLRAMPCTNMALVLAIDASGSISDVEYALQLQATARALRHPQVVAAMIAAGGVAVAAVIWGDAAFGAHSLPWVQVTDTSSADRLARTLASQPRLVTGNTDMGNGISVALDLLADPNNCASHQVIDVSGDGRESMMTRQTSTSLRQARARADAAGVVINGLAVSTNDMRLAGYFQDHVIQGPGAFVIEATTYEAFEHAMIQKLLREVGGYSAALTADAGSGPDSAPDSKQITLGMLMPGKSDRS